MAATYRLSRWRHLLNALVRSLLRVGLGPRHTYLLTVQGRRSGTQYSTPVTLVEEGRKRWLVAPYGEVSWVRNARAAGQVTLSRGRHTETLAITELGPEEAAPVLKRYVTEIPITVHFLTRSQTLLWRRLSPKPIATPFSASVVEQGKRSVLPPLLSPGHRTVSRLQMTMDAIQRWGEENVEAVDLFNRPNRQLVYSNATKDSGVFMNVDHASDYCSPESKNRDYFLGSL
jgi:deazaflavin-dependent oxidoreductase (nitroreductase family)